MATTDNVIHKGEKEEKYELYVEDYVMSYLRNYGATGSETIFFYGKREKGNRKYYIYGAGRQKDISYFMKYELLDEISCRFTMDMPVFSIKEESKIYETAGYYIFYQSNEAMQNYMVEQRKIADYQVKTKTESKIPARGDISKFKQVQEKRTAGNTPPQKTKNGLMTMQLAAIFVVLIAIVINSTNSYTKLEELNQAAVEVFFAMENQEAYGKDIPDGNNVADITEEAAIPTEGTVLKLEDLDAKFEEENQVAKQDGMETTDGGETAAAAGATDGMQAGDRSQAAEGTGTTGDNQAAEGTGTTGGKQTADGAGAAGGNQAADATEKTGDTEVASIEEAPPSKQAFARNFAEYYQIEKGDTLYTISIKIYGDTSRVNEICELNQIKDPDNIKYGQKILLP